MQAYFLIALGGALGSVSRFWLSNLVAAATSEAFPWGTIVVNVTGSLLIGILAALAGISGRMETDARAFTTHFLIVGVCGGYTTFSSFSLQTFTLLQSRPWLAGANIVLSVVLCILATWLGHWLGSFATATRAS